jgi:hypothetical protein
MCVGENQEIIRDTTRVGIFCSLPGLPQSWLFPVPASHDQICNRDQYCPNSCPTPGKADRLSGAG